MASHCFGRHCGALEPVHYCLHMDPLSRGYAADFILFKVCTVHYVFRSSVAAAEEGKYDLDHIHKEIEIKVVSF